MCVRPLRSALATNHFTLSGCEDAFEPAMAFHGFRCAQLTGGPKRHPGRCRGGRRRHRRPPRPRTVVMFTRAPAQHRRGAQIGRLIPDPVDPARQGRRGRTA
ncbi:family 78 glycoside hydrolase catalytic domain [Streptomyces sp. Ag82_O1-15]|uniref:family 78 glycoside hydrolase catalytic domain n=1 Tax=Streptomyces sp. Ag82_O1-15 TaxID=1938855 RepID=UPI0015C817C2